MLWGCCVVVRADFLDDCGLAPAAAPGASDSAGSITGAGSEAGAAG